MIKKIISGGQTGADRAALDFAIEVGIPYGGWVPKGRKAEDGEIPAKYNLQEMKTASYPARTKQNVLNSHGTLIISHGKLTGGSLGTRKLAEENSRPCLHIDLTKISHSIAVGKIINWLAACGIEILNIAGSRASKDAQIYGETLKLLRAFYHMATVSEEMPDPERISPFLPKTVEEALEVMISVMTLKDMAKLARISEEDLIQLHPTLGAWVRDRFELSIGNHPLMNSCRKAAGKDLDPDSASFLIIRKLRERLKKTHTLKQV